MIRLSIACAILALLVTLLLIAVGWRGLNLLRSETPPSSETAPLIAISGPPITPEDVNAIYKKVLHEILMYDSFRMAVIQAYSTGCPLYEDEEVRNNFGQSRSLITAVKSRILEAEVKTLENYLEKNRQSTRLENLADLGIKSVIVTDDDLRKVFPRHGFDRGWTQFYKKYPASPGILFFSNIGFNDRNNQAFLYAGRHCGGLCGSGKYVLLKKENGVWTIQEKMELWVS